MLSDVTPVASNPPASATRAWGWSLRRWATLLHPLSQAAAATPAQRYWAIGAIVLVVLLEFARFVPVGLVSTDFWPVLASNQLQSSADLVRLFHDPIGASDPTYVQETARHFRPLVVVSYALDYALWGLDRPAGWQLTNLAIHLGVCLGLYGLVRALGLNRTAAVLGVIAFASHPAIVSTVPGIARRHDTLSALFLLVSINALLRGRLLLASVFFACSVLAKESSLVAVPFLPALLVLGRQPARWSLVILPAIAVSIGMRLLALGDLGGYGTATAPSFANASIYAEKFLRYFQDLLAPALLPVQPPLFDAAIVAGLLIAAVWAVHWLAPGLRALALLGLAWVVAYGLFYAYLRVYAGAWYLYQPLLGVGLYVGAVATAIRMDGLVSHPLRMGLVGLVGLVWIHASPLFTPYPEWADISTQVRKYLAAIDTCTEDGHPPLEPIRRGPYASIVDANGLLDYSVRSYLHLRFPTGERSCGR